MIPSRRASSCIASRPGLRDDAVRLADVVIIDEDVRRREASVEPEALRRSRWQMRAISSWPRLRIDDRADRDDPGRQPERARADGQAGRRHLRTRDIDVVRRAAELLADLHHRFDIAERRQRLRAHSKEEMTYGRRPAFRSSSALASRCGCSSSSSTSMIVTSAPISRSSSRLPCISGPFTPMREDQHRLEAVLPRRGGDLAAPVRLRVGAGDDRIRAARQHLAEHEFELPRLVAAEGEPGHVVALDQDVAARRAPPKGAGRLPAASADAQAWCAGNAPAAPSAGRPRVERHVGLPRSSASMRSRG